MARDDEPMGEAELAGFVSVVFARNVEQAERFRELLEDHDIPALVGSSDDIDVESEEWQAARRQGMTHGVPVLVPEALLDEASEVIADLDDTTGMEEDDKDEDDEDEDEEESEEGCGLGEEAEADMEEEDEFDDEDLFGGDEEGLDEPDDEEN
jgi:hypothetical protein